MEIERKFRINALPLNLQQYPCKKIEQGYLNQIPTLRIRKSDDDYYLTYKNKTIRDVLDVALRNDEFELPLTETSYYHLREKIDYFLVKKRRYLIPIEKGLTAELDIFEGRLAGLRFVEVEFTKDAEAEGFEPPEWFGEEVTFDKRYRNLELAKLEKWKCIVGD